MRLEGRIRVLKEATRAPRGANKRAVSICTFMQSAIYLAKENANKKKPRGANKRA
jgi:hypothetical protein